MQAKYHSVLRSVGLDRFLGIQREPAWWHLSAILLSEQEVKHLSANLLSELEGHDTLVQFFIAANQ